jgi:Phage integrase, N-terminal SAM-like domain
MVYRTCGSGNRAELIRTSRASPRPAREHKPLPRTAAILRMITSFISGTPAAAADTYIVPSLIADAGDPAAWRYVEFFTANIRNANTRRAYARACVSFFAWCDERGLTLTTIRPHDVATYIETRQQTHSAPDVKQQLAAVRMLFDWLITGQIVPVNPAAAVRSRSMW